MANKDGERVSIALPHKITLQSPIKWGEETRTEITINRKLKAKDFKGIRANDIRMDDMLKMLSKITGEPQVFIEELEVEDLFTAIGVLNSFLPIGLVTGENP